MKQVREYVVLECQECKRRNYYTQKETKGSEKLALKKHCKGCRKHTPHVERKK